MIVNIHNTFHWAIRIVITRTIFSGPQIRTFMTKYYVCKIGTIMGHLISGLIIVRK